MRSTQSVFFFLLGAAPGPGISVNEEALTRREPFYQYDAPGVTAYAGVDVSSYQGVVDWPAVKAAGADFAILRVGFRLSLIHISEPTSP